VERKARRCPHRACGGEIEQLEKGISDAAFRAHAAVCDREWDCGLARFGEPKTASIKGA
jgi:hypothetical protein